MVWADACRAPGRRYARRVSSRALAFLCLCAILVLASSAAPATSHAALGGSSAFSELTEGQTETTPSQTTSTSSTAETTSNSSSVLVLVLGAAVLLLIVIAFLIVRDARSVAPAGDGPMGVGGSKRDTAAMMRKRRAKAKAARRQRKQNSKRRR
jgi:beta-lactamase regulating signal transducer with metallopeptidase domain